MGARAAAYNGLPARRLLGHPRIGIPSLFGKNVDRAGAERRARFDWRPSS